MKSNKKPAAQKPVGKRKPELSPKQKEAIKRHFELHPVKYTVTTVFECISPKVKALIEARKKQQ